MFSVCPSETRSRIPIPFKTSQLVLVYYSSNKKVTQTQTDNRAGVARQRTRQTKGRSGELGGHSFTHTSRGQTERQVGRKAARGRKREGQMARRQKAGSDRERKVDEQGDSKMHVGDGSQSLEQRTEDSRPGELSLSAPRLGELPEAQINAILGLFLGWEPWWDLAEVHSEETSGPWPPSAH